MVAARDFIGPSPRFFCLLDLKFGAASQTEMPLKKKRYEVGGKNPHTDSID